MKTVVFSDIAGTIVESEPWQFIRQHPQYNQQQGKREMQLFTPVYIARKVKLISDNIFRDEWLKRMASAFKGMSKAQIMAIYADVLEKQMKYRDDVIARLHAHRQNGAKVILVSGMFDELGELFAQKIGADGAIGTSMEFAGDIATGKLAGQTCVGGRKVEFIQAYLKKQHPQVSLADCYGYADSYSDKSLLEAVGHGVATYPDNELRPIALAKGWEIIA